ncbi:MAG: DUF1656 domain-containing protein [Stenotrophobium sp.]
MPRELSLFGIYFPTLLLVFAAAAIIYWLLDSMLARIDFYRHVWHPALFRACLFVCLLGILESLVFA